MKEAGRAALIIGVNDYRALDPSGLTDLRGACNDARVWAVAARSLGMEQIRILTSPPLSADDLSIDTAGITFGEATAAEIRDGVGWLAGRRDRRRGCGAGDGRLLRAWLDRWRRARDLSLGPHRRLL
jgi:hypothetical protein